MSTIRALSLRSFGTSVLLCAAGALGLAGPAQGGDWYVDAVFGDDAHDGQSAASAWRTLTHSIQWLRSLPPEEQTLHVAPGTYDPALGEVFPLRPPPLLRIVGSAGPATTIVSGASATLFLYISLEDYDERSGLTGLTLRDAVRGIALASIDSDASFTDLVITSMSGPGVRVNGADPATGVAGKPVFLRCDISDATPGVLVTAISGALPASAARAMLVDSRVHDCPGIGIEVMASGDASSSIVLDRCRVERNGLDGVRATAYGGVTTATVDARASLFAFNQRHGLFGGTASSEWVAIELIGCTVAHNVAAGGYAEHGAELTFENSIVAGNGDDVHVELQPARAFWSDCPRGDFLGWPGCIAADPLFVAPGAGDLGLAFGSPCVDRGDAALSVQLDLAGRLRDVDGDLDTLCAVDMGALEFETLTGPAVRALGERAEYAVSGAGGAGVLLLLTLEPLASPVATDFGTLALSRARVRFVRGLALPTSGGPLWWALDLPHDPAWSGATLAVQALIDSPTAPWGAALSNPTSFTVTP